MLIRRILREKFVENKHSIHSYVEFGDLKNNFIREKTKIFITYSLGRKRGNRNKQEKFKQETKQSYEEYSVKPTFQVPKVGFDDEPDQTDNYGFDPEDYNIFNKGSAEQKTDTKQEEINISDGDLDDLWQEDEEDQSVQLDHIEPDQTVNIVEEYPELTEYKSIKQEPAYEKIVIKPKVYTCDLSMVNMLEDRLFETIVMIKRNIRSQEPQQQAEKCIGIFTLDLVRSIVDRFKRSKFTLREWVNVGDNSYLYNKYKG